jgi:hypothetical protein
MVYPRNRALAGSARLAKEDSASRCISLEQNMHTTIIITATWEFVYMMKKSSKWIGCFLAAILILLPLAPTEAGAATYTPPVNITVHSEAVLLQSLDTGQVLYEKKRRPAHGARLAGEDYGGHPRARIRRGPGCHHDHIAFLHL